MWKKEREGIRAEEKKEEREKGKREKGESGKGKGRKEKRENRIITRGDAREYCQFKE